MTDYRKPLPIPDDLSRSFWEGARRHELTIERCTACRRWTHPPEGRCPACGGDAKAEAVSGRATLYTFTVSHYVGAPGFEAEAPYVIVVAELEEQTGLRLVGNLRDCPREAVRVGLPLEAVFEDVTPDVSLPQFRPRQA